MKPIELLALVAVLSTVAGSAIFTFLGFGGLLRVRQVRREEAFADRYAKQYDVRRRPFETDEQLARRIYRTRLASRWP